MSFEDFFEFIWESELVFVLFCVAICIIATIWLIYVWMKKQENSECTQEAWIVKKEETEAIQIFLITFVIKASREEKEMYVKREDGEKLSVNDRGMLTYRGNDYVRFIKETTNVEKQDLSKNKN